MFRLLALLAESDREWTLALLAVCVHVHKYLQYQTRTVADPEFYKGGFTGMLIYFCCSKFFVVVINREN